MNAYICKVNWWFLRIIGVRGIEKLWIWFVKWSIVGRRSEKKPSTRTRTSTACAEHEENGAVSVLTEFAMSDER